MTRNIIDKILTARVYDVATETPLQFAHQLSARLNNQIWLKREDLQPVFSFKLRGAYNKIFHLSEEERERGVICASAGNHAQGVALSAKKLGIKSVIVMPRTTPDIKVSAVKALGGKAVLHGDSYDDALTHALKLAEEDQLSFVHPYDDPYVIAGQGTVAQEILRQHPEPPDAVFVCVGGGGLIAGIASYIKHLYPKTKIIGVEADDAASMHDALKKGRRVKLKQVGLFADGASVRQVGKLPFEIAKKTVDEIVLVSTDEICASIKDVFDDTRTMLEPAGALSVAGMKKWLQRENIQGKNIVAIASGANINFDRLRHVAERAEVGEQREAVLAVTIPEKPGSFRRFCRTLGKRGITEFNYRYADDRDAHVFVGVKLSDGENERKELIDNLISKDYPVVDLTSDEMAKLHIRHMVGGHARSVSDERLFRVEFPERPGALLKFLTDMGKNWNISLFHYRNHGAAFGRVLVGIQIPKTESKAFHEFANKLGYQLIEETDNPAYRLFLG